MKTTPRPPRKRKASKTSDQHKTEPLEKPSTESDARMRLQDVLDTFEEKRDVFFSKEEEESSHKYDQLIERQRALYAKAGVDMTSRSPLLALAEQQMQEDAERKRKEPQRKIRSRAQREKSIREVCAKARLDIKSALPLQIIAAAAMQANVYPMSKGEEKQRDKPKLIVITALGRSITKLKTECGWSYDDLAENSGIDKKLILGHVNKGKSAHPNTLKLYADTFSRALNRTISVADLTTK